MHRYGFASPEAYFEASDLRRFPMDRITVPTLMIVAKDDPVSDAGNFSKVTWSRSTQLLMPEHGGHVGFVHHRFLPGGTLRWAQYRAVRFIAAVV